jgi:DNA-binding response OmpR family regulator
LRELIARIRALLRRAYGELAEASLGEKIRLNDIEIDLEQLRVSRGGDFVYLTPTEFRMLRYLATHPNRPISRAVLIDAVWGYEGDIGSDRTVDVHIRHLRQKLEEDPADPHFLITVRGVGYKIQTKP